MRTRFFNLQGLLLTACAAATLAPAARGQVTQQPIAITGQTAVPGGAGTFDSLGLPSLNQNGQASFTGTFTSGGTQSGVFGNAGGALQALSLSTTANSPVNGSQFAAYNQPVLSGLYTSFPATYTGPGSGVFAGTAGSVGNVALSGQTAPGTASTFLSFGVPRVNTAGSVAFSASLSGSGHGIFDNTPGSLSLVARNGTAAPGGTGGTFTTFSDPGLNSSGIAVFQAGVQAASAEQGIFTSTAGTLAAAARTDSGTAPGTGAAFTSFQPPTINADGDIVFRAGYAVSGGSGIFGRVSGGPLINVALAGDAVPGLSATFSAFGNPTLAAGGQVAFLGQFDDATPQQGLFSGVIGSGTLSTIARTNDGNAPGTSSPFSGFLGLPVINDAGQVAFMAEQNGGSDIGVWGLGSPGALVLLARTGDAWDMDGLPGGETRTISQISFASYSSGGDGVATGFNNAAQVALQLTFTDNTQGLFLVTIPEPATMLLLAAGLPVAWRRRRQPAA